MRRDALKLVTVSSVAVFLLAVLTATLGNAALFGTTTYTALFHDSSGLRERDDVRISGVNVGRVEDVDAVDGVARVRFAVEQDVRLTTETRAFVRYKNVIGQRYLELETPPGPGEPLGDDVIPLTQTAPALDLTDLFNGFRPLFDALEPEQINTLANTLVQTLQGESGNVASLVSQLSSLTGTIADRDAVIARVVGNLDVLLGTVAQRDADIRVLLDDLRSLSATAAADREALTGALDGIDQLAATTAELLQRARPALQQDIASLNAVLATVVANQEEITAAVQGLPPALAALNRAFDSGAWLGIYACNLRFSITSGSLENPGAPILSGTPPDQAAVCR